MLIGFGLAGSTTKGSVLVTFPTQLRILPTLVYSALSDFRWTDFSSATNTNQSALGIIGSSQAGRNATTLELVFTGTPLTQYRSGAIQFNGAGGRVVFEAEIP